MSDVELRELERRWRASGAPADEARVLAERLRLGELTLARLELAAYVGHVASREALGGVVPAGRLPLSRWVSLLDDAGRVALVRTARDDVLARLATPAAPLSPALASAGLALQEWCACPCTEHARAVRDARPAARPLEPDADRAEQARVLLAHALRTLCDAVAACGLGEDDRDPLLELVLGDTLHVGADPPGAEEVLLPDRCPLVGWALGPEHAASPRSSRLPADASRVYLAGRVRRGEVGPDRLALAAYAGDPDAAALSGSPVHEATDVHAWVVGLARFGEDLPKRAVARLAARSLSRPLSRLVRRREAALERLEDANVVFDLARQLDLWADQPAAERRERIERLANQLDAHLDALPRHLRGRAGALRALVEAAAAVTGRRTPAEALSLVLDAVADQDLALASLKAAVASWALR